MRHSVARTGVGGGPLRSESARLPGVTLALAAPGPPVQLRWTTLRVQGPTLRDAALANDGDGSPPGRSAALTPPSAISIGQYGRASRTSRMHCCVWTPPPP